MLFAHGSDLCHDLELRHAMANCFEALLGALYLDGGIEVGIKIVSQDWWFYPYLCENWCSYWKFVNIVGCRQSFLGNVFWKAKALIGLVDELSATSVTRTRTRWRSQMDIDIPIVAGMCLRGFEEQVNIPSVARMWLWGQGEDIKVQYYKCVFVELCRLSQHSQCYRYVLAGPWRAGQHCQCYKYRVIHLKCPTPQNLTNKNS